MLVDFVLICNLFFCGYGMGGFMGVGLFDLYSGEEFWIFGYGLLDCLFFESD